MKRVLNVFGELCLLGLYIMFLLLCRLVFGEEHRREPGRTEGK